MNGVNSHSDELDKVKPNNSHPPETLQSNTQEDADRETSRQQNPNFSLANSESRPHNQGEAYIDPHYRAFNPQYGNEQDEPVWSLAQPLPHVVRDGMRHGALPEDREEDRKRQDPHYRVSKPDEQGFFNTWSKIRHKIREPLGEWLGTTVAMTIGLCASLSTFTSQSQAGTFPSQSAAWGFGFMMAIYITGGVSGGHLNPTITISLSVWRGFPARRCILFVLAQILGAITAGGFAYAIYHDAIVSSAAASNVPQNQSPAAQALYTAPKEFVSPVAAFFNEFVGSAILVGAILALGDDTNAPPGAGMQAFIIGILITILCLALGYNTGGCFNGARDFGPRLVAVMAGWGGHLFRDTHAWWVWGPWVAGISGGLFGAFVYDLAIFTGGESPINYPSRRWKRTLLIKEKNVRSKLGFGRNKVGDIERAVENVEN